MSGYIGNDGSQLAGGLNPSSQVQGLSVDASGKLNVNASVSSGPTNITEINGAALSASNPLFVAQSQNGAVLSATNPEINISNIQQLILNGQGFSVTTGKVASAVNMAAQFWVPSTSTKNVLIWSVRSGYSNANQSAQLDYITAQDTNITGTGTNDSANFLNLKAGGAAAASGATLFHNGGVAGPSGTPLDFLPTPFTQNVEMLSPGMFLLIPAGTAAGLAVYQVTTATGSWVFTVRFVEF